MVLAGATFANYVPLHHKLNRFPALLTTATHVDLYHQWTHEALVTVADFWLRDPTDRAAVPWSDHSRLEQIASVATAMAYIHTSSKAAAERLFSHHGFQYKFFTPRTYKEFVHIFKVVAAYIYKKETVRYQTPFDLENSQYPAQCTLSNNFIICVVCLVLRT